MLPAAQRLRRRGDFAATFKAGRRAARGVVMVHLKSPDVGPGPGSLVARVGFVVSKAVGGAVERNLVKRRLRELTRQRLVDLPAGTDLVVRARPGAALRRYPQLAADLDAALAAVRSPRPAKRGSEGR